MGPTKLFEKLKDWKLVSKPLRTTVLYRVIYVLDALLQDIVDGAKNWHLKNSSKK